MNKKCRKTPQNTARPDGGSTTTSRNLPQNTATRLVERLQNIIRVK